jgi:hypothetical protein
MALLINPANGATHHHTVPPPSAKVFQWSNTNPIVPNGTHWRLKIGSGPFGYNYHNGPPVLFTQLQDGNVGLLSVPSGRRCYATVEWSTNGAGGPWSNGGTYTSFYCYP